ncbi:MAG: tagaturonate epimerase family protein [Candidatus Izemoplasmatales bacterium]|nr:tagaturonate epimerase family protein [Candidatus Izemoplasmatales bacterium]
MASIDDLLTAMPDLVNCACFDVYPKSVNWVDNTWVFMIQEEADMIVASGERAAEFEGVFVDCGGVSCIKAPLSHINAKALRRLFSFTAPIPVLTKDRSFGVGDRLGIATPGHIQAFESYDAYPIFAQQSIRELNMTHRTYHDVLDVVTFAVFREGYKRGFGADGDHLKKPEEIKYALDLGYSMITLDCSEHIDNRVVEMSDQEVCQKAHVDPEMKRRYLGQSITIEGETISFSEVELSRNVLVYGKAIDFASAMYDRFFKDGQYQANFEISIDETETPTTPQQHYFVASELMNRGVKIDTLAPRFCGEFQKGVDYIGDIDQFTKELKIHAAISRHFGYKLSIHSGSDKFSVFALIGHYTRGRFHVKTAGTNWLEAMRAVAMIDPDLYREIHHFALESFAEAKKFYHVTTHIDRIPEVDELRSEDLPKLFEDNDARQLIHITYGFILNAKNPDGSYRFKDRMYRLWRNHQAVYHDLLKQHIGKHLELLYSGFKKSN